MNDPSPASARPPSDRAAQPPSGGLAPLHVPTRRLVLAGTALWAVALLVTLVVPGLHEGDRSWWPWTCVAGIGLGGLGLAYLSRGRGNASSAG